MSTIPFLWRRSRGTICASVVAGLASLGAVVGLIHLVRQQVEADATSWGSRALLFAGLTAVMIVSAVGNMMLMARLSQNAVYDMRLRFCRQMLATPLRHLERAGPSSLMAHLIDDVLMVSNGLLVAPLITQNLAILLGCLVYLGFLSWQVLAALGGILVVGLLVYTVPARHAIRYFAAAREGQDGLLEQFRGLIQGAKELKLQDTLGQQLISRDLGSVAEEVRRANISAMSISATAMGWGQLLMFGFMGVVLFVLPLDAGDGGVLTACVLTLFYMMGPLNSVVQQFPALGRTRVALEKIRQFGNELEGLAEGEESGAREKLDWGVLELDGVQHSYYSEGDDRHFVLGPLSLRIEPGELLFITGGNGSGKSTLVKLLIGLYPPEAGDLRLGGEVITPARRGALRQLFSVVFADYYLFPGLVSEQHPAEVDQQARAYLERLQLDHKVKVEGGRLSTTELSSGQRKRLALLAAYLTDRPCYVFDEWAADQDPAFKAVFYRELLPELKRQGKTVIVVSHDDKYYDAADRVIKLDYGQIEVVEAPAGS